MTLTAEQALVAQVANPLLAAAVAGKLAQNADPGAKVPLGATAVIEPKCDGWRIIAYVGEDGATLFARSGNTYTDRLPHICKELAARFPAGTWLDGEAVALTVKDGRVVDEWGDVQSVLTTMGPNSAAAKKVTFMVFDLLAHEGIDARKLSFFKRRELLERIFDGEAFQYLRLIPQMAASQAAHDAYVRMGFEGSMVKRDTAYASGARGHGWTKVKVEWSLDAVIMGFTPSKTGTGLIGSLIFGQYVDGVLTKRGTASGMSMKVRKDMTANPAKYKGQAVEIVHNGAMKDGLRHPRFKRLRPDKDPTTINLHNGDESDVK